jgi:uncharacterized caspase-like protein
MAIFTLLSASRSFLMSALALAATLLVAPADAAVNERRVALVIGNSEYAHVAPLENPLIDSKAVAASLKRLGFEVVEGYNLNMEAMRATVGEYAGRLDGAKVALVYYAGHGIAVGGDNYLIPTDAVLKSPADVDFRTLNINLVLRQMQREERVNVVILDACRDNPLAEELSRSAKGTRSASISTGLSEINTNAAAGTLIAFATDPGKTALDGKKGENSPFTTALLRHMETPGISISSVMDRVREEVWRSTGEKQRPWVNTSIIGEFYLNPEAAAPVAVAALSQPAVAAPSPAGFGIDRQALEMKLWESAERSNTAEDYKSYLEAHPTGYFAALAKNRIAKLQGGGSDKPAVIINEAELKAQAGTAQTEAGINLAQADRTEAQHRLRLAGFDAGSTNGKFGPTTRQAIASWQKSRSTPETGYLTKMQLAALREQTQDAYSNWLSAQSEARSVAQPATRRGSNPVRAAEPQLRRSNPRPVARQGGPSLGEVGQFLGGVGTLVGGFRR